MMRLIFMGTPAFSVVSLQALKKAGHEIVAVYSQPPRQSGRGMALHESPVALWAQAENIEVRTPISFKQEEEVVRFKALRADVAIVVAYGLILPAPILSAPQGGCFNIHASLLPRWRGAAPIQRAVMAGDTQTGITIMQMEVGLDSGPICLQHKVPIHEQTTSGDLHDVLAKVGAQAMVEALELLSSKMLRYHCQSETQVSYAAKITKQEACLNFNQPDRVVVRHIHGLSPAPGAWFDYRGQRIKILKCEAVVGCLARQESAGTVLDQHLTIACAQGAIRPLMLQRAGKGAMGVQEFQNGLSIIAGTKL